MVNSVDVPTPITADVLDQASKVLPPALSQFRTTIRLGEAFEVWTLQNFAQSGNNITAAAVNTGSLHHQLLVGLDPVGFVRSSAVGGATTRTVTQVASSRLAKRVQDVIDQVGPRVSSAVPARLVVASAYRLYAFWFPDVAQSCVIACPATYTVITPGELIAVTDFMTRLHNEQPVPGALLA